MSRRSFRPQLEQLEGRCVPSRLPALSIDNVAQVESTSGQPTAFVFTVSLSQASKQQVSVNYATADGTATAADNDYVPTAGKLTFAPGQTTQRITVMVNGDSVPNYPEGFFVDLSGASRASIANAVGDGTILAPPPPGYAYIVGTISLQPYQIQVDQTA
jgi:Calx-beta domain-containing protein